MQWQNHGHCPQRWQGSNPQHRSFRKLWHGLNGLHALLHPQWQPLWQPLWQRLRLRQQSPLLLPPEPSPPD